MKRILLILTVAAFLFSACDTNPGVSKAFAKYSHNEGVTSITVPGWLIGIGASFADLCDEEKELLDCIDKVKVLAIENEVLNGQYFYFIDTIEQLFFFITKISKRCSNTN